MLEWAGLLTQDLPPISEPVPAPEDPVPYVPQILIENLPAGSDGLTQPWATVAAGCLAVVAATIALLGIRHQAKQHIRATKAQLRQQRAAMVRQEKQLQRTIDAQKLLHDDAQFRQEVQHSKSLSEQRRIIELEIESSEQKQVRADRLDALIEATKVLADALNAALQLHSADNEYGAHVRRLASCLDLCEFAQLKLALLGATASASATTHAILTFSKTYRVNENAVSHDELISSYRAAQDAFKEELRPQETHSWSHLD